MNQFALISGAVLFFVLGAIWWDGGFMPIVETGLRLESIRVSMDSAVARVGKVYTDRPARAPRRPVERDRTREASFDRPRRSSRRDERCVQGWDGNSYYWVCI